MGISREAAKRHALAVTAGHPTYRDPETGFYVMTAAALRKQGSCCGRGCRHCPWSAAEQRRAGRPFITGPED